MRCPASQGRRGTCATIAELFLDPNRRQNSQSRPDRGAIRTLKACLIRERNDLSFRSCRPAEFTTWRHFGAPLTNWAYDLQLESNRDPPHLQSPSSFRRARMPHRGGLLVCPSGGCRLGKSRHGVLHEWLLQHSEAPSPESTCAFRDRSTVWP